MDGREKKKSVFFSHTELTHLQLSTERESRAEKRGGLRSHVRVFQVFIDAGGVLKKKIL